MSLKVKQIVFDENQNVVPALISPSEIIDLTEEDDERPPIKKVVILNNGRGDYSVINRLEDQPGPSGFVAQRKSPRKSPEVRCVCCESKSSVFIDLQCHHRVCYNCFNTTLKNNKEVDNRCPRVFCLHLISDSEIKNFLTVDHYTSFLEHSRDVLRKELNLRALEINFLGSKSVHGSEPSSQRSADDDIIIFEPAKLQRRRSELINLQNLDNMSYVKNPYVFECPVCLSDIEIGDGIILKNCLHTLCVTCFEGHVKMYDDPEVLCPYNSPEGSCEFLIQEREIRAIVSPEVYDIHLSKGLKRAETVLENIYHCKTPDCIGFVQHDEGHNAFVCNVCNKVNCIKCKTIHEDKTCQEYKDDLINDVKNQQELKLTEAAVQEMITKGEAMLCPKCDTLIQKHEGCDWVQCVSCKLGICYRTKKPRLPLTRVINGVATIIDGCHCNEKVKNRLPIKCHPKCGNCH